MEDEVKRQWTEVNKGGDESPVLNTLQSVSKLEYPRLNMDSFIRTYLVLMKYRAEAIEQLKGSDDLALHQSARKNRRCRPPSRT